MMKRTLAVLVEDRPGVLTHVSGLISRRAFNIVSINAGYSEDIGLTRITVVVDVANEDELEQVINQISKLVDVIAVVDLTGVSSINRELALIKVKASPADRLASSISSIFSGPRSSINASRQHGHRNDGKKIKSMRCACSRAKWESLKSSAPAESLFPERINPSKT